MTTTLRPFVLFFAAALLPAQVDLVTEQRVKDTVTWLAADERGGRDTPSPGLEEAASWLAKRFEAAGLQQVAKDSWFHDYTLPGLRLDSASIALKLVRQTQNAGKDDKEKAFELQPDRDVRLWRASDVSSGSLEAATVAQVGDPVLQQMVSAQSGRRPIVIEVPEDHPWWARAAGARDVLGSRRAAARPIFLVRAGILPPAPGDGTEAMWAATWSAPAAAKIDIPLKNVVAVLPGAQKREEFVVVSAHYDHIGTGNPVDGDTINNGADDDASGTTAVVLIAEAMAKQPPPSRSVLFVCFSAEEKGLRGSAAFAEHPPVPLEKIVANVNIEMIGRPEPGNEHKAWITGHDLSDFAAIAAPAMAKSGVEVIDFKLSAQLFGASDNYSFARRGIVAHSISAGSLHADYHKPGDEAGKLDIPHMTRIVRALHDAVREFADREAKPEWNAKGKERLANGR